MLLLKRILEESIAAEELNKILAMEQVVSSDVDIADAFLRIQELAHRLVDWQTFRIGRLDDGELRTCGMERAIGILSTAPSRNHASALPVTRVALQTGDIVIVTDARAGSRGSVAAARTCAASS